MALFRRRPTFFPTAITVVAVALCVVLGIWQIQRLEWKRDLIDMIETRSALEPVVLPASIVDPASWDYRHVSVTGTFRHDQESYLNAQSTNGNYGYQVITPLERTDGETVLINRGWVPYDNRDPATRSEGQVSGEVAVNGLVRRPWQQGWFASLATLDSDPVKKIYFEGNLANMAAAYNIEVMPVFVDADGAPNPGGWPKGGQTVLKVPNNHLSYTIQWFSLAIAGLVIFVIYHRREDD